MNQSRLSSLSAALLLGLFLFAAACTSGNGSQTPVSRAAPADAADPDATEGWVVDSEGNGDAEAARKAAHADRVKQLERLLENLGKTESLAEAFVVGESIEDLGKDIRPELEERVGKLPELPRIAGLRALWMLDGWDPGVYGLLAIVEGEGETETRVAAAEVLGALASVRHEEALRKSLKEKVFEPTVKVQLAVALWRSARDTAATDVLREMLQADNESFRIQAALALGEIFQITSEARPILELLSEEPSLRGRVARRVLDYERAVKRLEAAMENRLPGQPRLEKIDTSLLDHIQGMIQERYIYPDAVEGRKLIYAAASGMLKGLDPYTCLLEENQLKDAAALRRFAVPSLGLSLGQVRIRETRRERVTVVLSVAPGSPADRAGIRPLDRVFRVVPGMTVEQVHLMRVNEFSLPEEDVTLQELPLDEAVSLFRGAQGASLGLQFRRDRWLLSRWVHLTHEAPAEHTVHHEILPGGVGVIRVSEVGASAPAGFERALAEFREQEVKALVLDLRGCSAGSVEAAAAAAGLFLPKDALVTYRLGRSEELAPKIEYRTSGDSPDLDTPLAVVTDAGTADAAEILAGALKEHGRAVTVGEKTFGRAIHQELIMLRAQELEEDKTKAGLLLTVARFYSPVSQVPYYDRGVEPDRPANPHDFEGWVYDELDELSELPVFETYLTKVMRETDEGVLLDLARGDRGDPAAWPGFADFYKTLLVHTDEGQVRWLVRGEVRRRLLESGRLSIRTDLEEDAVFAEALRAVAEQAKIDLSAFPEYKALADG